MLQSHIGHVGTSGIQAHSAGPIFPFTIVHVGYPDRGYVVAENQDDGTSTPRFYFHDAATRRDAYAACERAAFTMLHPSLAAVETTKAPEFPPVAKTRLRFEELAALAAPLIRETGGFSLDTFGRQPDSGFMVSLPNNESVHSLDYNTLEATLIAAAPLRLPTGEHVAADVLGFYWGGWIDGALLYLDTSINVASRERAEYFGRKFKQLAIYDVRNRESIRLD